MPIKGDNVIYDVRFATEEEIKKSNSRERHPTDSVVVDGDRVVTHAMRLDYAGAIATYLNSETAPLHARIAELEAALGACISALDRTLYTHTPKDPQTVIDNAKQVLYKKAPDHD